MPRHPSIRTLCALPFLVPGALAHMQMSEPSPLRDPHSNRTDEPKDYNILTPLSPDGSNFACKGYQWTTPLTTVATYKAGGTYPLRLMGSATHGGGSCQISLSCDYTHFNVIKSMEGDCPIQKEYEFTIPVDMPTAEKCLMAWTWFNKIGNREMYMNCAVVDLVGASGPSSGSSRQRASSKSSGAAVAQAALSKYPSMYVANLKGVNDCVTKETTDVLFDDPGSDVAYGDGLSASSSRVKRGKGSCTGVGRTASGSSSSDSSNSGSSAGSSSSWSGGNSGSSAGSSSSGSNGNSGSSSSSGGSTGGDDGMWHPEKYGGSASSGNSGSSSGGSGSSGNSGSSSSSNSGSSSSGGDDGMWHPEKYGGGSASSAKSGSSSSSGSSTGGDDGQWHPDAGSSKASSGQSKASALKSSSSTNKQASSNSGSSKGTTQVEKELAAYLKSIGGDTQRYTVDDYTQYTPNEGSDPKFRTQQIHSREPPDPDYDFINHEAGKILSSSNSDDGYDDLPDFIKDIVDSYEGDDENGSDEDDEDWEEYGDIYDRQKVATKKHSSSSKSSKKAKHSKTKKVHSLTSKTTAHGSEALVSQEATATPEADLEAEDAEESASKWTTESKPLGPTARVFAIPVNASWTTLSIPDVTSFSKIPAGAPPVPVALFANISGVSSEIASASTDAIITLDEPSVGIPITPTQPADLPAVPTEVAPSVAPPAIPAPGGACTPGSFLCNGETQFWVCGQFGGDAWTYGALRDVSGGMTCKDGQVQGRSLSSRSIRKRGFGWYIGQDDGGWGSDDDESPLDPIIDAINTLIKTVPKLASGNTNKGSVDITHKDSGTWYQPYSLIKRKIGWWISSSNPSNEVPANPLVTISDNLKKLESTLDWTISALTASKGQQKPQKRSSGWWLSFGGVDGNDAGYTTSDKTDKKDTERDPLDDILWKVDDLEAKFNKLQSLTGNGKWKRGWGFLGQYGKDDMNKEVAKGQLGDPFEPILSKLKSYVRIVRGLLPNNKVQGPPHGTGYQHQRPKFPWDNKSSSWYAKRQLHSREAADGPPDFSEFFDDDDDAEDDSFDPTSSGPPKKSSSRPGKSVLSEAGDGVDEEESDSPAHKQSSSSKTGSKSNGPSAGPPPDDDEEDEDDAVPSDFPTHVSKSNSSRPPTEDIPKSAGKSKSKSKSKATPTEDDDDETVPNAFDPDITRLPNPFAPGGEFAGPDDTLDEGDFATLSKNEDDDRTAKKKSKLFSLFPPDRRTRAKRQDFGDDVQVDGFTYSDGGDGGNGIDDVAEAAASLFGEDPSSKDQSDSDQGNSDSSSGDEEQDEDDDGGDDAQPSSKTPAKAPAGPAAASTESTSTAAADTSSDDSEDTSDDSEDTADADEDAEDGDDAEEEDDSDDDAAEEEDDAQPSPSPSARRVKRENFTPAPAPAGDGVDADPEAVFGFEEPADYEQKWGVAPEAQTQQKTSTTPAAKREIAVPAPAGDGVDADPEAVFGFEEPADYEQKWGISPEAQSQQQSSTTLVVKREIAVPAPAGDGVDADPEAVFGFEEPADYEQKWGVAPEAQTQQKSSTPATKREVTAPAPAGDGVDADPEAIFGFEEPADYEQKWGVAPEAQTQQQSSTASVAKRNDMAPAPAPAGDGVDADPEAVFGFEKPADYERKWGVVETPPERLPKLVKGVDAISSGSSEESIAHANRLEVGSPERYDWGERRKRQAVSASAPRPAAQAPAAPQVSAPQNAVPISPNTQAPAGFTFSNGNNGGDGVDDDDDAVTDLFGAEPSDYAKKWGVNATTVQGKTAVPSANQAGKAPVAVAPVAVAPSVKAPVAAAPVAKASVAAVPAAKASQALAQKQPSALGAAAQRVDVPIHFSRPASAPTGFASVAPGGGKPRPSGSIHLHAHELPAEPSDLPEEPATTTSLVKAKKGRPTPIEQSGILEEPELSPTPSFVAKGKWKGKGKKGKSTSSTETASTETGVPTFTTDEASSSTAEPRPSFPPSVKAKSKPAPGFFDSIAGNPVPLEQANAVPADQSEPEAITGPIGKFSQSGPVGKAAPHTVHKPSGLDVTADSSALNRDGGPDGLPPQPNEAGLRPSVALGNNTLDEEVSSEEHLPEVSTLGSAPSLKSLGPGEDLEDSTDDAFPAEDEIDNNEAEAETALPDTGEEEEVSALLEDLPVSVKTHTRTLVVFASPAPAPTSTPATATATTSTTTTSLAPETVVSTDTPWEDGIFAGPEFPLPTETESINVAASVLPFFMGPGPVVPEGVTLNWPGPFNLHHLPTSTAAPLAQVPSVQASPPVPSTLSTVVVPAAPLFEGSELPPLPTVLPDGLPELPLSGLPGVTGSWPPLPAGVTASVGVGAAKGVGLRRAAVQRRRDHVALRA